MEKSNKASEDTNARVAQTMEQARGAMESYLQFLLKGMLALPWADTDLNKKVKSYAEQNVANAFGFAEKLAKAKDFQDLVRIQTQFTQMQLKSLSEQAKDLGETAAKTTTDALKGPAP